jgi:hypothetical protein
LQSFRESTALFILRQSHAKQERGFIDVVVLIAAAYQYEQSALPKEGIPEDTDTTGLEHSGKREVHRIPKPAPDEAS